MRSNGPDFKNAPLVAQPDSAYKNGWRTVVIWFRDLLGFDRHKIVVRIFASLSVFTVLLLLTNLAIGLWGGDYNAVSSELRTAQAKLSSVSAAPIDDSGPSAVEVRDDVLARLGPLQSQARLHMLFGILTALVAVLVQSIGVTYFIGTGRWGKEVCDTYQLRDELNQRAKLLKRRAFPWAMSGMAAILLIACLGAAADPGTLRETTASWVQPHLWSAMLGTCFIAFALWRQWVCIGDNQRLIEEVVESVHAIRVERGLPVDEAGPVSVT